MEKSVRVLLKEFVTHNTKRFVVERPEGYRFTPGQATEVSIDHPDWREEKRPFTFTSLDEDLVLEFVIKCYSEHDGVTKRIHALEPGDRIILRDVWGTIDYKGPGVFIAGGAGITPFIAILRRLKKDNKIKGNTLIFSNKTSRDIILREELETLLGDNLILTLTREKKEGMENRRIDKEFLQEMVKDFSQNFYVCGPPEFVKDITKALRELGANPESLVFEE